MAEIRNSVGGVVSRKMEGEELRQWLMLRGRARRVPDGRKKASKSACRKPRAGDADR